MRIINYKTIKRYVLIFLSLSIILTGCSSIRLEEYTKNIFALNTYITLTAYGGKDTPKILDKAEKRVMEIEELMSTEIDTSDVALINKNAGIAPVEVSEDTFYVIERALWYSKMSDGAFDITIYPISKLWDITGENPRVPNKGEIEELLPLVNYREVILDKDKKTVFLSKTGMGIDLGAIAKGYAADEVGRILRECGIEHALINLGGDIVALGNKPDGNEWNIGVRDPRGHETGAEYIAVVKIADNSIVSSGDYERYLEEEYENTGKRYHHIFDPKTGYPADSGLIATTVIAEQSIDADALSTCLFVMGKDKGLDFLKEVQGSKGLCIDENRHIYISSDIEDLMDVTSEEYRLEK